MGDVQTWMIRWIKGIKGKSGDIWIRIGRQCFDDLGLKDLLIVVKHIPSDASVKASDIKLSVRSPSQPCRKVYRCKNFRGGKGYWNWCVVAGGIVFARRKL